jgi:hypothetical protein
MTIAQAKLDQLTVAYNVVHVYANIYGVEVSAEITSNIQIVRDSADQLYNRGIESLREAINTARELLDDEK